MNGEAAPLPLRRTDAGVAPCIDDLVTPVWIYDPHTCSIPWANRTGLRLWESSGVEELASRDLGGTMPAAVRDTLMAFLSEVQAGNIIQRWWQLTPRGIGKNVFCQLSAIRLCDGTTAILCEGLEEVGLHSNALDQGTALVGMFDADGRLSSCSASFREVFGDGADAFSALLADTAQAALLLDYARQHGRHETDTLLLTDSGLRWHSMELRCRDATSGKGDVVALLHDVHERRTRDRRAGADTVIDALTGLLNRVGMQRRLDAMMAAGEPFTLFYVDLDGFKLINDTFGHAAGDEVLAQVARRIESLAGSESMAARIGGDEFVIASSPANLRASVDSFATWLVKSISRPYATTSNGMMTVSGSVGMASFPEHGTRLDELLANADTAMYAAKSHGRRRWHGYAHGMRDSFRRRTLVAQQLPGAGVRGELSLDYQPISNSVSGEVLSVEALLRWHNPALGNIPPLEAIAAAEHTGLIVALERWVFRHACQDLLELRAALGQHVSVNVNVSGYHLAQPRFTDELDAIVAEFGLVPSDLVLELVEDSLLPEAEAAENALREVTGRGYRLAIDDFGTGYSCLAYLHRLPATYVKIDRAFISRVEDDPATIACIQTLVNRFGMHAVAEGVETPEQCQRLLAQGVDLQQGYLHDRPMPLHELLARHKLEPGA